MTFLDFLHRVSDGHSLSESDAAQAMTLLLEGQATPAQVGGFLVALRMKGETVEELAGFTRVMRAKATRVEAGSEPVLDTCGTGGDGQATFNISTVTALVVAAAGVRVAKHGNRSATSLCGSADILEALGVRITMSAQEMGQAIREIGIGFLFAPALHPAMKFAAPVRSELKLRTVFNLLGPLANPAGAAYQIIGAPSPKAAELMARALARVGTNSAYVVHGSDGLDEVTTTGPSMVWHVEDGGLEQITVTPQQFGVERATLNQLQIGSCAESVAVVRAILDGERGAPRDIVLVNAAVALMAARRARSPEEGVALAARSVDSGAAKEKLARWVEFSQCAA